LEDKLKEAYGDQWQDSIDIPEAPEPEKTGQMQCSFCGKTPNEVAKLIAGPAVNICNECVDICNEVIADEEKAKNEAKSE
jgi:hypothetical protein